MVGILSPLAHSVFPPPVQLSLPMTSPAAYRCECPDGSRVDCEAGVPFDNAVDAVHYARTRLKYPTRVVRVRDGAVLALCGQKTGAIGAKAEQFARYL